MEFCGRKFKPFDDFYYVSEDGEVYSTYKRGLLKKATDVDGYYRVDIHGKHMKVHKLVYLVWHGPIEPGLQINHINDNKKDNRAANLYAGSQRDNISDCQKNGHRVGHTTSVTVYDKRLAKTITFPDVKSFISYTGHSIANGSLSKCTQRKWFSSRFVVIEQKGVTTIESKRALMARNKAEMPK